MCTSQSKEMDIALQLAGLEDLSSKELRTEWRLFYRSEPPVRISRDMMIRAVAYKIQERAYGGLKGPIKRKLKAAMEEYKKGETAKSSPATKLQPGVRLVREWRRRRYDVQVLDNGFEFEGRTYSSLTAIAREITGTHWSGPRFFGLNKAAKASPELEEANQ